MQQLFSKRFWEKFYNQAEDWVITELPGLVLITLLFFILYQLIRFVIRKVKLKIEENDDHQISTEETKKRTNTIVNILQTSVKIGLLVVYILMVLNKFGVNVGPLLASVGFVGLALGFGAQELVRDLISGFFILLEDQIRNGDVAIINGTGGLVEKISLRTITLRYFAGVVHIYQNGKIDTLSNMTKEWSAMVMDIGVAYKEDVDQVTKVMQSVCDEIEKDEEYGPLIIEPIEILGLDSFGESSINIKVRIRTKPISQWHVGREFRRRIKYAFDQHQIEIPFPHRTLYWGEQTPQFKVTSEQSLAGK